MLAAIAAVNQEGAAAAAGGGGGGGGAGAAGGSGADKVSVCRLSLLYCIGGWGFGLWEPCWVLEIVGNMLAVTATPDGGAGAASGGAAGLDT